jgi:Tfp pilus assembly protein PilF
MKPICFLFLLMLACQLGFSQNQYSSSSKSAIKSYERARYQLDLNNFKEAESELNTAIKQDDKFVEAYLLLADVYRVTFDNLNAKATYKKAFAINPNFAPDRYYYFDESQLKTGDYQEALQNYQLYKDKVHPASDKLALADKYIADCVFALKAIKNPVNFKPENLGPGVNTKEEEYFATLTADESTLIFTRQTVMKIFIEVLKPILAIQLQNI